MPKIVGGSQTVVDHEGLTIDELAGNVATQNDRISIAHVKVANASSEPWLTLDYDEWMCVLKGRMVLLYGDGKELEVSHGQTVFIERGERFRPTFPEGGTEYVPVCLPAFRPDRCVREEEAGGADAGELEIEEASREEAPAERVSAGMVQALEDVFYTATAESGYEADVVEVVVPEIVQWPEEDEVEE